MGDPAGVPTTGLLTAVGFLKDNRLLPRGFEKNTAGSDIAVVGDAAEDVDFADGIDRVRILDRRRGFEGPFRVRGRAPLSTHCLPVGAEPQKYTAPESRRFVTYFEAMASASSEVLARAKATCVTEALPGVENRGSSRSALNSGSILARASVKARRSGGRALEERDGSVRVPLSA